MAPEMLNDSKYDFSIDVWATALIFLEILSGKNKVVFKGNNKNELLLDIEMTINLVVPDHISEKTKGLIMSMLTFSSQRPTFAMLEIHPLVSKYIKKIIRSRGRRSR